MRWCSPGGDIFWLRQTQLRFLFMEGGFHAVACGILDGLQADLLNDDVFSGLLKLVREGKYQIITFALP